MKSLLLTARETLDYRETPAPLPTGGELIVRVAACGICGSDLHRWHGYVETPVHALGHEASGWIENGPRAGESVAINPTVSCMSCVHCLEGRHHLCTSRSHIGIPPRAGAFADYVSVPEINLVTLPKKIDMTEAALMEPLAVSCHGVDLGTKLLKRPLSACRTLVLGGGAIGVTSALMLKLRGAKSVELVEHAPLRIASASALDFGAVHPAADALADGGFDLVLDAVGADATRAAATRTVRSGGVIVHLGLSPGSGGLDIRRMTRDEIIFTGSICYTPADFSEAVDIIADGRLPTGSLLERRPMRDGARAFSDIAEGRTGAAKIILCN